MVEHSAVNRVVVGSSPTRGVYINYILLKYVVYVMMIQSLNTGVVNSEFGSVVKRLRHRPFTAVTRVRFPSESLPLWQTM